MLVVFQFIWIFCGSIAVGVINTLLSALALKASAFGHGTIRAAVFFLFSYAAFFMAESVHLSGIVASLTSGIGMSYFSTRNVPHSSKLMTRDMFTTLAKVAETLIFFEVGENVVM